jgi:hypothetical protein
MEFQVGGRSVAAVVQEFQPLGEHVLGAGVSVLLNLSSAVHNTTFFVVTSEIEEMGIRC